MGSEVESVAQQCAQAVTVMMDPTVAQTQRHQAFTFLEQFKETSPLGSQCGFLLSSLQNSPPVRHFGLKILEDIVKARWNDMSGEEKVFIKNNLMKMVENGTKSILEEANHIKDQLAKIIVELIKREWPQQWPSLLTELDTLCQLGETQTELVMFVLLRLVEDVAVLQTLEQNQRRREIYSALTSNMEQIFRFLLTLLESHYKGYLAQPTTEQGKKHCKVCMSILNTFTSLVEWVPMQHIMANNKYLLHCLTHLLKDERLQMYAAECLLAIVSWKAGKTTDRVQILSLFETEFMQPLFAATQAAETHALEESHYNFMKKMVQILTVLGEQLCNLWTKETPRQVENLRIYLEALIAFTRHPSQTVNHFANDLWAKFFRHVDISKDETFKEFKVVWTQTAIRKTVKIGFPSSTSSECNNPSTAYSQLDFDDDEDFKNFFVRYRLIIIESIKIISSEEPAIPLSILDQWLRSSLSTPLTNAKAVLCDLEAISCCLDAVYCKMSTADQLTDVYSTTAQLVKLCLDYTCDDLRIQSEVISCISSMFVVVLQSPEALHPILEKVFNILEQPADRQDSNVRSLRRHCCALMIRLSSKFPTILFSTFQHLQMRISNLRSNNLISKNEFCCLMEALFIISNQMNNYSQQCEFVNAACAPILADLVSLQPHYIEPINLINFIGLNKEPVNAHSSTNGSTTNGSSQPTTSPEDENRGALSMVMNFLLAVSRRVETNTTDAAAAVNIQINGKMYTKHRNAAGSFLCHILQKIFVFSRTMNLLFSQETKVHVSSGYQKAFDLLDADKNNILGLPGSRSAKNELTYQIKVPEPVTKMQNFLTELFESVQHLLSHMSSNIGYEFYAVPHLGEGLCMSVLSNLQLLPDFRLRAINRMFLKNFISNCPEEYLGTVLIPILKQIAPVMRERLQERWEYLRKIREDPKFDEDNTDSQEVLDDVIIRVGAREYLDTVKAMLKDSSNAQNGDSNPFNGNSLSVLGEAILMDSGLRMDLMLTCLQGIRWPDSPSGTKAASLVELMLPKLCQLNAFGPDEATSIMVEILSAFQEMGMHEANNIALTHLALLSYETLRPAFPNIVNVLQQVPGVNPEDLMKFDNKIITTATMFGEKAKKDMFKKLIQHLVGKDVAKMFQKEIVIKNLPNLVPTKVRAKTLSLDEQTNQTGEETGILQLFNSS